MFSKRRNLCLFIVLFIVLFIFPVSTALAEIKTFVKEVEEIVGRDRSQEQVEAFALQKAKRLAVEEAGTYISSLTIVRNYKLQKDEVTALASGVVQAKIVGIPTIKLKNGVVHISVKAIIKVDTSLLERQIEVIMKEKKTLIKLEAERQQVKQLENELASLKSSEQKRLEELNAQAIALEREREKRRLIIEEQSLKARGELKKAEIERLKKARDLQVQIDRIIYEQEKVRKKEAEAIAKEQDRIRHMQLENEQRWNELIRKAQLRQAEWVSIDSTFSLKQTIEEANQLKEEIGNLKKRIDFQYRKNKTNLEKVYEQQIALTIPQRFSEPAEKDSFEPYAEYKKRISEYEEKVRVSNTQNQKTIERLKAEQKLKITRAEIHYIKQQKSILAPFIKRLQLLQETMIVLPEGKMSIVLGDPDSENNRFPLYLKYKDQRWTKYWSYTDRNQAKDFWKTRSYLIAEGLFQLEEHDKMHFSLTGSRITHLGTGESRDFRLETPTVFVEIKDWNDILVKLPQLQNNEEMLRHEYERSKYVEFAIKHCEKNYVLLLSSEKISARYQSLNKAIEAATPGSIIFLCHGTFYETVNLYNRKELTFIGDDASLITPSPDETIFNIENSKDIDIEGLHLVHETNDQCGANVFRIASSSNIKIHNSDIAGSGYIGVALYRTYNVEIFDNKIHDCHYGVR